MNMENNMITVESLIRRIELYIEDNSWEKGIEYCNRVLDMDPENSKAYLLLLLCNNKAQNLDELAKVKKNFDLDSDYKNAYKFGDKELRDSLDKYLEKAKEYELEKEYQSIKERLSVAETSFDLELIIKDIEKLNESEETTRLLGKAKDKYAKIKEKKKEDIYELACGRLENFYLQSLIEAKDLFENIKDYKDSKEKIEECNEKIAKLKIEELEKKKRKKRIITLVSCVIVFLIFAIKIDLWHLIFPVFSSEKEMIAYLESSNWEIVSFNESIPYEQVRFIDGSMHFYYKNRNQYAYEYIITNYRAGKLGTDIYEYTVNKNADTFTEKKYNYIYKKTDNSDLIDDAYTVEETREIREKESESKKESEADKSTVINSGSVKVKSGSLNSESLIDNYHITGTVTNTTIYTVTFVKVKVSLTDSNGNVIDTCSTYAVGSEGLAPGESSQFEVYMNKNSDAKKFSASVYDYQY